MQIIMILLLQGLGLVPKGQTIKEVRSTEHHKNLNILHIYLYMWTCVDDNMLTCES